MAACLAGLWLLRLLVVVDRRRDKIGILSSSAMAISLWGQLWPDSTEAFVIDSFEISNEKRTSRKVRYKQCLVIYKTIRLLTLKLP
jgi:hypothetical protein